MLCAAAALSPTGLFFGVSGQRFKVLRAVLADGADEIRGQRVALVDVAADLAYEADIQTINAGINPDMETVFFIPSREYMHISSSVVRGLVGFVDWETVLVDYVHPFIIKEFKEREES